MNADFERKPSAVSSKTGSELSLRLPIGQASRTQVSLGEQLSPGDHDRQVNVIERPA